MQHSDDRLERGGEEGNLRGAQNSGKAQRKVFEIQEVA